jgi:hypothetical protein
MLNILSLLLSVIQTLHFVLESATEGKNGQYKVTSGLKSLAAELGVTHEALYRTLALLVKNKTIRRDEALLLLNH